VHNAGATSPFLLLGDHAGNRVPRSLDQLGLPAAELERHIGWDIGVAGLGVQLADKLDATFIRQVFSRLVIDCNRRPEAPDSIPRVSDGTTVPGNAALDERQAAARAAAIQAPYQQAIADELDRRLGLGLPTVLVSLHSFTPAMNGIARPWHIGILHDRGDNRFAVALLKSLAEEPDLVVGDNEPYSMDTIDFTVPIHAYPRALPYAEIEIRQDLLGTASGIEQWSERMERQLIAAEAVVTSLEAAPRPGPT
jgi:predicted N-formylglutamate amidohydrolase